MALQKLFIELRSKNNHQKFLPKYTDLKEKYKKSYRNNVNRRSLFSLNFQNGRKINISFLKII